MPLALTIFCSLLCFKFPESKDSNNNKKEQNSHHHFVILGNVTNPRLGLLPLLLFRRQSCSSWLSGCDTDKRNTTTTVLDLSARSTKSDPNLHQEDRSHHRLCHYSSSRVSPALSCTTRTLASSDKQQQRTGIEMDTSSIITQVQRPADESESAEVAASASAFRTGSNSNGSTATTTTAAVNNNITPSLTPTSGHKSKSRHRPFMETMDRLFCCFRSKSRRNEATVTVNSPGMDQDDYFMTPKLQGKCLLPPLKSSDHQMCLVIDLDETLVHSSFKPISNPDFIVPVEIDGTIHQVYVLKRPFVDEFLQRVGELYECVLFTASLAKYADPVADLLDKWGVFRSRLFRESCVFYRGNYVKDLGRLGRDLHKVVIVDNSPASYIFHPDNAVPVASWFDNVTDTELRDLIPFFEKLSKVENIYTVLRNANHVSLSPGTQSAAAVSTIASTMTGSAAAIFTNHNTNPTPTPGRSSDHLLQQHNLQQQSYPLLPLTSSSPSPLHHPQIEAPATPGSVIHSSPAPPLISHQQKQTASLHTSSSSAFQHQIA